MHTRHTIFFAGYIILLFALLLFIGVQPGYAQTPESTAASVTVTATTTVSATVASSPTLTPAIQATSIPAKQNLLGVTEVTFAQLDQAPFELHSPTAQWSFSFDAPYRWVINSETSFIELHYEAYDSASSAETRTINGTTDVYFNNVLAISFSPLEGPNQAIRIPIPLEAVSEAGQDQHELRFTYVSNNCDDPNSQSLFSVHDHSLIHFEHELLPIEINLTEFPRPLVQNPFQTESILIIIPDQFSDADLAAAASVAAAVGQRTFGGALLDLITASEVTPAHLAHTSAIIIGQPNSNAFLANLYQRNRLPTSLSADGLNIVDPTNETLAPDDGVLQEIISDFSDDHVYLIVTGASDVAVARAAQTLSVIKPRYGFFSNLVIVTDFYETFSKAKNSTDTFSLADLGFENTTFYGINAQKRSVNFFIPSNWRFVDKPTLTLSYLHSSQLQFNVSSLTIKLNNEPVGSAPIDDKVLGERQVVIELPRADLKLGGYNRLDFEAILNVEFSGCVFPDKNLTWIRINDTSQLKLPHVEAEEDETHVPATLRNPFSSFASRQDLSDVWFSLPQTLTRNDLVAMINAAQALGSLSGGPGFAPKVTRGVISDAEQLKRHHIIAFGRPTSNPVIATVNEHLPQPFVPGEDNLRQEIGNVVYRLPANFSIGLLQSLPSPWNPGKAMLVATGTTPEGVEWATNALTGDLYYELTGDLAFIQGEEIESFDSTKFIRIPLETVVEPAPETEAGLTLEEVVPTATAPPATAPTPAATVFVPAPAPPTPSVPILATPTPPTLTLVITPQPVTGQLQAVVTDTTIPDHYLPQNYTPLEEMVGLALSLIGVGVIIAVAGIVISNRKQLTGPFIMRFFGKIYDIIPEKIQKLLESKIGNKEGHNL